MPEERVFFSSSAKALAVRAIMGTVLASGRDEALIRREASPTVELRHHYIRQDEVILAGLRCLELVYQLPAVGGYFYLGAGLLEHQAQYLGV